MSKNVGLIKIKGKVGDLSFYQSKGKNLVRMASTVEKGRIMKDPAYKRTRENMAEFGASARIGKSFRNCFGIFAKRFGDENYIGRITGLMREIISNGSGRRGERVFEVVANKEILEGFEFNPNDKLQNFFSPPFTLTANAARNELTLNVPVFDTDMWMSAPEAATHFSLICIASVLSDFAGTGVKKKYEPAEPLLNELSAYQISAAIETSGLTTAPVSLTAVLPGAPAMTGNVGLLAAVGIEFYQEINGEMFILATDNALKKLLKFFDSV